MPVMPALESENARDGEHGKAVLTQMNARQRFELTIQRPYMLSAHYADYEEQAHSMFRGYSVLNSPADPENEAVYAAVLSDGLRMALVLAVSAMDAYFTDKYVEAFIPYLRKRGPNQDMVEYCTKAKIDVRVALELLCKKRPLESLRAHVSQYLSSYVAQDIRKIDDLYKTIGLRDLSRSAQAKSHRSRLILNVEAAVRRRHEIAHSGDVTKAGHLRRISAKSVEDALDCIKYFVRDADDIINHSVGRPCEPAGGTLPGSGDAAGDDSAALEEAWKAHYANSLAHGTRPRRRRTTPRAPK